MEDIHLNPNWDDAVCPICLDFPHNGVLLQCSSYDNGCRPFVCDTDHFHSNCLDRFRIAYAMSSPSSYDIPPSTTHTQPMSSDGDCKPACPLCRGDVTGWIVVDKARLHLDEKKRACEEGLCGFIGTYPQLKKHTELVHPNACPSIIDPARQLDWENFQQSSEIIDVLSTIHSQVPRGVVLGDYVIEYGVGDSGDEFEEYRVGQGNWWTSCILYKVFNNLRSSRNRRRSRVAGSTRRGRHSSYDASNSDEGSVASVEFGEYRVEENDNRFTITRGSSRVNSAHHHSSRRRRSRLNGS